jgi:AcrR family transcriptional regulator
MSHKSNSSRGCTVSEPVTARGQQTRQKILKAAEEVFGKKGYHQSSIIEITQRAGVAQGTFYVYFPNKESAFTELVKALSYSWRREVAEAIQGISDRVEVEQVGFRIFFAFLHKHPHLHFIVRQAQFVDEELFRWYYRRLAEGYVQGLTQAMEAGQIRSLNPECLAYCLMGIGDFLGMRWVIWGDRNLPKNIFQTMMSFIKHGLAVPPSTEDSHSS